MNDIKVNVNWSTSFSTMEEVQEFLDLIGNVHNQMYCTPGIVANELTESGFYHGAVNYILADVEDNRKVPGVFNEGDTVRILGFEDTDPNHEGRVDFVKDGQVHVNNMNMPFAGSISKFFKPNELEHY